MRLVTRILYPLRRNRIAVLGARSAPKRYCQTSQGLCRDIKGGALGWFKPGGHFRSGCHGVTIARKSTKTKLATKVTKTTGGSGSLRTDYWSGGRALAAITGARYQNQNSAAAKITGRQ